MDDQRHAPFFYKQGSKRLVFFIHGYCGSPCQFMPWVKLFTEWGYDCKGVLLPGHGTGAREFAQVTGEQWKNHVIQELGTVRGDYEEILVFGHSMGGTLSLLLAAQTPEISGVIALCPAAGLHFHPAILRKYWGLAFGNPARDSDRLRAARESAGVVLTTILDARFLTRPVKRLRTLISELWECAGEVRCPVLLIRAMHDEVVSGRAIERLGGVMPDVQMLRIPGSDHVYMPPPDRDSVNSAMKKLWIRPQKYELL